MGLPKRKLLFQLSIFRCYVSFEGNTTLYSSKTTPKAQVGNQRNLQPWFCRIFQVYSKRTVTVSFRGEYNKFHQFCPNPFGVSLIRRTNYQLHQSMFQGESPWNPCLRICRNKNCIHFLIFQTNGVATDLIPKNLTVKDTMKKYCKIKPKLPRKERRIISRVHYGFQRLCWLARGFRECTLQ